MKNRNRITRITHGYVAPWDYPDGCNDQAWTATMCGELLGRRDGVVHENDEIAGDDVNCKHCLSIIRKSTRKKTGRSRRRK